MSDQPLDLEAIGAARATACAADVPALIAALRASQAEVTGICQRGENAPPSWLGGRVRLDVDRGDSYRASLADAVTQGCCGDETWRGVADSAPTTKGSPMATTGP